MRDFKRIYSEKWVFTFYLLVAFSVTSLKIWWSQTRPIFLSGPDAETYIGMSSDLVNKGFFSADLTGVPTWSQGYPSFLHLVRIFTGSGYESIAQIIQIILYSLTVEVVRRIAKQAFGYTGTVASLVALIITVSPSGFFYPQEAMYETLLLFSFYSLLYLVLCTRGKSVRVEFTTALFISTILVVHERSIIMVLLVLIFFGRFLSSRFWVSLSLTSLIPAVFIIRNGVLYETWRLQAGSGIVFKNSISAIQNDGEILNTPFGDGARNIVLNMLHFWTTYSGYGKRGTWMHNATLDFWLDNFLDTKFIMYLSFIFMCALFVLFLRGIAILSKNKSRLALFTTSIFLTATLLSGLSYGDSRHRLVFAPLLILVVLKNFSVRTDIPAVISIFKGSRNSSKEML